LKKKFEHNKEILKQMILQNKSILKSPNDIEDFTTIITKAEISRRKTSMLFFFLLQNKTFYLYEPRKKNIVFQQNF